MTSINERAEKIMGRRLTPEQEKTGVMPIDYPCELGYWCPVCKIEMDEELVWSEYSSFLWCARCDKDIPSALCIPLTDKPDMKAWEHAGIDDAISVFLDSVQRAIYVSQLDSTTESL